MTIPNFSLYLRRSSRKRSQAASESKTSAWLWLRQLQWLVEPSSTRRPRGIRGMRSSAEANPAPVILSGRAHVRHERRERRGTRDERPERTRTEEPSPIGRSGPPLAQRTRMTRTEPRERAPRDRATATSAAPRPRSWRLASAHQGARP